MAVCRICGNSSVGRAQPCQGWGREFESRFPLQLPVRLSVPSAPQLKLPTETQIRAGTPVIIQRRIGFLAFSCRNNLRAEAEKGQFPVQQEQADDAFAVNLAFRRKRRIAAVPLPRPFKVAARSVPAVCNGQNNRNNKYCTDPPCSSQGQVLWGKRKLWKVFSRDQDLSLSAVGRIKPKRRRRFRGHARRWQYGMRAKRLGELARIDRMSVGLPAGFGVKEFKAACPVTGFVALNSYSRATSRCAKDFLAHPGSGTLVPPSWQWLGEAEASLAAIMPISEVSGLAT